jgi:arsenate reductase
MKKELRIYFLCGENRCRSQIAEAYAKVLAKEGAIVASAGLNPTELHPITQQVMKEVDIELHGHSAKKINMKTFLDSNIIVKLCEETKERCPIVPFGTRSVQWNITAPLAASEEDINSVRKARDEIKQHVIELLAQYNALKEVTY